VVPGPSHCRFVARFSQLEVRLVEHVTTRLVEGLQAGELDVAIASPPVANADVVCSELFREQILLAVAGNHHLANATTVDLSEIRNGDCCSSRKVTVSVSRLSAPARERGHNSNPPSKVTSSPVFSRW
jgi:DNA-binding transcriptional LysR family regulator